jgi:hypothetical protein
MTDEKQCLCNAGWDALGCPLHGAWRPKDGALVTDLNAKARELHAELVGVHGDDCAPRCCKTIAAALTEARAEALEEAARLCDEQRDRFAEQFSTQDAITANILACRIRARVAEREGKRNG